MAYTETSLLCSLKMFMLRRVSQLNHRSSVLI